jgi:hypothetical protein
MKPDSAFSQLPADFWAYVRFVSESLGYSKRAAGTLRRYTSDEILAWLGSQNGLSDKPLRRPLADRTYLALLVKYLNYRADTLESCVRPHLMDREEAKRVFRDLKRRLKPKCALPLNKQKGDKRHEAYLSCIVNMLTEQALGGCDFDQSPRTLVTVRRHGAVEATLSRRMDGAYPTTVNRVAVWEVKEYYGTTTFGSRIADGVYETMLDGYEIMQLREASGVRVLHYLLVDDRYTWWDCGRSYLCRIVDALHAGLLDEVLFGREVVERWPKIMQSWPKSV